MWLLGTDNPFVWGQAPFPYGLTKAPFINKPLEHGAPFYLVCMDARESQTMGLLEAKGTIVWGLPRQEVSRASLTCCRLRSIVELIGFVLMVLHP